MCFVFVFAALLEYAAVNYTYWGARAKKKKKEKKQRDKEERDKQVPVNKGAQVEQEPSAHHQEPLNTEEIIELQDLRMSPIPSLRNRHSKAKYYGREGSGSQEQFPPSFRMHRNYSFPTRGSSNHLHRKERRRTRLMNQLRKGAGVIKSSLPKIKDVNVIDKYSRVVFPVSFILFNVMYWCFYVLEE